MLRIVVGSNRPPPWKKARSAPVEQCTMIKCLRVMIDEHLSWSYHVDYVCKKVYASLSMLRRVRPYVDENTLNILYLCLVQSHLDYCCEIWGLRLNLHTERIIKLKKERLG